MHRCLASSRLNAGFLASVSARALIIRLPAVIDASFDHDGTNPQRAKPILGGTESLVTTGID